MVILRRNSERAVTDRPLSISQRVKVLMVLEMLMKLPQARHGPTWNQANTPSTAIQRMVIGISTFQPRRMIWS